LLEKQEVVINIEDVEVTTEDIPGWAVASINGNTVALDISISKVLQQEGLARELINRIQNLRKDIGLEVTDKVKIQLSASEELTVAINENLNYICSETLANQLEIVNMEALEESHYFELISDINTNIKIIKS
jgi:isoleucyl-tRNA synthetase